jgi:hypothetical protein
MRLEDVFGIGPGKLATYVKRGVDEVFEQCLQTRKHIVLHGSSKQGKTSLRKRYLGENNAIVVSCQSNWDLPQLYLSILRRAGCHPVLTQERSASGHNMIRFQVGLPGVGHFEVGRQPTDRERTEYRHQSIDPNDPNDVIDGLKAINFKKWIVVEDFHYLPPETQQEFATHLKAFFDESSIRFLLIAIWIGRNRITSLGDLAGRVIPVDADFWPDFDLREVIELGEKALNIRFTPTCKQGIIAAAGGSVFILQSLCYGICQLGEIFERQSKLMEVGHERQIPPILDESVNQLSAHYQGFLQAFSQGLRAAQLEMNKWILFAVLTANEEKLRKGLLFTEIDQAIKKRHPRGKDLNSANLRNALVKVDELQWTKNIKPFVIDYDEATRRLYIVDKSFYLWRRHQKQKDLLSYIDLTLDGEKATA